MAEQQQVNAVEEGADSLAEQGNFETIVTSQTGKPEGESDADIVSMAFADIDENTEYLQTVSSDSNLATVVDNVTLQSSPSPDPAPSETTVGTTADVSSAEVVDAVQQDVAIPQTVPSSEAISVSTLGNGNTSPPVSLPASMLLGTIANLIDTTAGATTSTMTISELQNNPALMNILNSAEVQAAIQNHQHITIVQVPDRSIIGELNGDKNVTHVSLPALAPISSTGLGTTTVAKMPSATVVTAGVKNTPAVATTLAKVTSTGNSVTKHAKADKQKTPKSDEKKKPHRAITRSGRISKPPSYRVRDYKTLRTGALNVAADTDDDYSDYTPDEDEEEDGDRSENFKYPFGSDRSKKFKCEKCDKSYIGRAGLSRHYRLNSTHGNADDIPEAPEPPKPSENKPSGRRPGRPPRALNNPASNAKASGTPGKTASPLPPLSKPAASSSAAAAAGVSILDQTETPSDVKVVYHPQSLLKRKHRIRELLKTVGDEDILELVLPKLSKLVTVWEFLLMKVEKGRPSRPHFPDVYRELGKVLTEVKKMASECLEPDDGADDSTSENNEDKPTQTFDIQDDAMAHALGISKGSYKVKDSPVPEYEFKYKLLVTDPSDAERAPKEKRIIEVVSQDELVDQSPTKKRKVDQAQQSSPQSTQKNVEQTVPPAVNHAQSPPVMNAIPSRPQTSAASNSGSSNQQIRKMPPLASIANRSSMHRPIKPAIATSTVSKPTVNSSVSSSVPSSGSVVQRRILTLPPGFNITKTSDGYAIHKPDGTTIQVTGGEGGIPLETLQALINMDTSIFQSVSSSTPAAPESNTLQSATSPTDQQIARTAESAVAAVSEASVAAETESQTEQIAMETVSQTEQIAMETVSQTEQIAMETVSETEQITMETDSQTGHVAIETDSQTEQVAIETDRQVSMETGSQIEQVSMETDGHTEQAMNETVFTESVSQTEATQEASNVKSEIEESSFPVESIAQEVVQSTTNMCTETSTTTIGNEGQILTNGNSVSHSSGVENTIVNNIG